MSSAGLTALQLRILRAPADIDPPWTLAGGGALVGFHLRHRTTRDLDLFWHERIALGDLPRFVSDALRAAGMSIDLLQASPSFHRLRVTSGAETCVVDLVGEPNAPCEAPRTVELGGARILVEGAHELLVSKLCTLLERAELRDLVDVRALLDAGGNLARAMADAPAKDGGFSPPTLAWVLKEMRPRAAARAQGWDEVSAADLERFLADLVERVAALAAPD